jgi:hypothetical protein
MMKALGLLLSLLAVVLFMAAVGKFKDSNEDKTKKARDSYFALGSEKACELMQEHNPEFYSLEIKAGRC